MAATINTALAPCWLHALWSTVRCCCCDVAMVQHTPVGIDLKFSPGWFLGCSAEHVSRAEGRQTTAGQRQQFHGTSAEVHALAIWVLSAISHRRGAVAVWHPVLSSAAIAEEQPLDMKPLSLLSAFCASELLSGQVPHEVHQGTSQAHAVDVQALPLQRGSL